MKQITLNKAKDYQIGNVRVNEALYQKIQHLAKTHKVSPQAIVRSILESFIDEVTFK